MRCPRSSGTRELGVAHRSRAWSERRSWPPAAALLLDRSRRVARRAPAGGVGAGAAARAGPVAVAAVWEGTNGGGRGRRGARSCACARDVGPLSPGQDVGLAQLCVLRRWRLGLTFLGLNLGSHPFHFCNFASAGLFIHFIILFCPSQSQTHHFFVFSYLQYKLGSHVQVDRPSLMCGIY